MAYPETLPYEDRASIDKLFQWLVALPEEVHFRVHDGEEFAHPWTKDAAKAKAEIGHTEEAWLHIATLGPVRPSGTREVTRHGGFFLVFGNGDGTTIADVSYSESTAVGRAMGSYPHS